MQTFLNLTQDLQSQLMYGSVFGILILATICWFILSRFPSFKQKHDFVLEVQARINAWWVMTGVFLLMLALGFYTTLALFLFLSLLALREYISLIEVKQSDYRALFLSFLLIAPFQYYLIAINWYGLYSIFVPVYVFLFIPSVITLRGDCENFLDRTSKIQWGLMVCIFLLSHAPALLTLNIPNYENQGFKLLFFLVFVTEMSDVFQFMAGKILGRHKIAPTVSPNKTWEGLIGGLVGSSLLAYYLTPLTPFKELEAVFITLAIVTAGFLGGLTMSAIKRDHGVKDFGTSIPGHGGILDRLDSLCFAAPLFFHITRYFFTV